MKLKKWLLAIAAFAVTAVVCAIAAGAETYGDFEYDVLDDGTVEITDYNGSAKNVDIPKKIDGMSVTKIGSSAFSYHMLSSVTIPDGVTTIGSMAFRDCYLLTSIAMPDSVTSIGESAFDGCQSLTDIKIPDGLEIIDSSVFEGCTSLTSITIPDGVWIIYPFAFESCTNLTNITIPDSVAMIGGSAFSGCESLTDVTIPDGVTDIRYGTFYNCSSLTSITIPDSVTYIDDKAFFNCSALKTAVIPASVTYFGENALGYHEEYVSGNFETTKVDGFKICCYSDTVGEKYANDKGFDYELLKCENHNFSDWTITVQATCTTVGTQTRVCSTCGKIETASVKKAAHIYINTVVKPTYTTKGYTLHKCSVCGENYMDNYTDKLTLAKLAGVKLTERVTNALCISWDQNSSADGYIIEMYRDGKWARVGKITDNFDTTFRKTGLSASSVYKFRVKAYRNCYKSVVYSEYSSVLSARTCPSVIKGAKLGGRAADALRINWTKNASADGYIVEMYQGNKWVRVGKITNNSTTTFRKAGLKASSVYKFRVRAYKMSGSTALYGNYSATVTARTNPSVMKGVKIAGKAKDALRVNWTKNSSAQGYIVEMYKGGKWVRAAKITNNNTTTFRKAGLAKNTTYKFRVKAYYMSGKTALYGNYGSVSGKTLAK